MAPVLPCLLLLALVPVISTARTTPDAAVPLESLADLPSFVYYQFGRNFSDQWKKCIEDGRGKCPSYYSVGKKGPCRKGQLYVYNRREVLHTKGSLKPVCQPRPCPRRYSLVVPDKKCYHDDDIELGICSERLRMITNLFGETFCGCEEGKATLLGSKKKECDELFTQGPCTRGSLFVPVYDLVNFGQGQCLPSPCAKVLNGTNGVVEIRLPNGRTNCVNYPSKFHCDENYYFHVDYSDSVFPGVQRLQCIPDIALYSAFYFASSERCVVNDEGLCVISLKKKYVEPHPLYID